MTIAITGASGPYARSVQAGLLERGVDPRKLVLISRSPGALEASRAAGSKIVAAGFDDRDALTEGLRGVDQVLMISTSRVGSREPEHRVAVEAAVAAGVRRLVYTSFTGTGGLDNPSIAVRDHRLTERIIRDSGLEHVFMRHSQYMDAITDAVGPHFIRAGLWRCAAGRGRTGNVSRDDCAAAAAGLLTGSGRKTTIYEITGPELLSFADLAAVLGRVSGRHVDYESVSEEEMYREFDARGLPREAVPDSSVGGVPWSSDDILSVDRALREGYMAVLSDDVELLSGRKPISFAEFAEQRAEQLRAIAAEAR